MKKVFISYRRDDNAAMAGRLYDSLSARFGQGRVFFDVDTIDSGKPFKNEIERYLSESGVLLAVIGAHWYEILQSRRSTPESDDLVAIELSVAHALKVPIVPVLVGRQAKHEFDRFACSSDNLAAILGPLQAIEVDEVKDYRNHVDRLIRDIEKAIGISRSRRLQLVSVVLIIISVFVIGYALSQYAFEKRFRGLPEMAEAVGLTSIDDGSNSKQAVPPESIFRRGRREIFMSGISCYRTFDQQKDVVDAMVSSGKELFVLILDPDSDDVRALSAHFNKPVDAEIRQVIAIVKSDGVLKSSKVHLRFMSRLPPYSAVMADGNVEAEDDRSSDHGAIRVQPYRWQNDPNGRLIFEFTDRSTTGLNGFDFFASDVRKQWANASTSDEKVAQMLASP